MHHLFPIPAGGSAGHRALATVAGAVLLRAHDHRRRIHGSARYSGRVSERHPGHRCQPRRLRRQRRRRHEPLPRPVHGATRRDYTLSYADTYKVLTVGETSPGAGAHTYLLVQCGTEVPPTFTGDLAGAEVVTIPVRTMFSESTSHDGFIDVLGLAGLVTGVADGSWVATPSIKARIEHG